MRYSQAYVQHRKQGPFPGRIDPWSEAARFFQQIHANMIGHLLTQIQDPLVAMGYEAGRETSLQILERREPDIFIRREQGASQSLPTWDYPAAAQQILAEPGLVIDFEAPELHAIYVTDFSTGDLVTIVEIVSPSNKEQPKMSEYWAGRDRLIHKGINIVEIDPTRSVQHLLQDVLVATYAYHIAVYLPQQLPRVIGIDFGEPLKRVALPLRGEVVPMELQAAYDFAYQQSLIAGHMYSEGQYTEAHLPFPSLLTEQQRRDALSAVETWQQELVRLSKET
jgi:hypothetical protein